MKQILQTIAFCILALPASAQDKMALARQYVNLPAASEVTDLLFSKETQIAQFKTTLPTSIQLSNDQYDRIGEILSSELAKFRPEYDELMIAAMAETFSAPELEALIAFYKSEHGSTAIKKMQPFMNSFFAKATLKMREMQQRAHPRIIKIMQEPTE